MQFVELLHGSTPIVDAQAILRRARELLPNVGLLGQGERHDMLHFVHPMYVLHLQDGNVPAQTAVALNHRPFDGAEFSEDLQQSWSCPDAGELIRDVQSVTLVTEL